MKKTITTIIFLTAAIASTKAGQYYNQAENIYTTDPDSSLILLRSEIKNSSAGEKAKAYYLAGYIQQHFKQNRIEALKQFTYALHYFSGEEDETGQKKSHLAIGYIHYHQKDYVAAKKHFKEAYSIDPEYAYSIHNLALVHQRYGQLDSASYLFSKGYEIAVNKLDTIYILKNLNELGATYFYANQYHQAVEKYKDLLKTAQHFQNNTYVGYALNNIGNALHDAELYTESIDYLKRALPYKTKNSIISTYLNIAECYQETNQTDQAIQWFIKAKNSAYNVQNYAEYVSALDQLMRIYIQYPVADSAAKYAQEISSHLLEAAQEKQAIYETANLLEIQLAEARVREDISREKTAQRMIVYVAIGIATLVFISGGFYFYIKRWRRRKNEAVRELEMILRV